MRKPWLIGSLLASHAVVAWIGFSWHTTNSSTHSDPSNPNATPPPRPSESSGTRHQQLTLAARDFGPDTDFTAWMNSWADNPKLTFTPRAEACFQAWLDHDDLAAVRWLALFKGTHGSRGWFEPSLLQQLEEQGPSQLARWFNDRPGNSDALFNVVSRFFADQGSEEVLAVVDQLKGNDNRRWLIRFGIQDPETFILQLPAIRTRLDDQAAIEIFWMADSKWPLDRLALAAEQAGFPQQAVDYLKKEAQRREASGETLARAIADSSANPESLRQTFARSHPESSDWFADFADRDLPADEIHARILAAEPTLHESPDQARRLIFDGLYIGDPARAVAWLKQKTDDWRKVLQQTASQRIHDLKAETLWKIHDDPDGIPELANIVHSRYQSWLQRDPINALDAIESLPDGPLRDQLVTSLARDWASHLPSRAAALESIVDGSPKPTNPGKQ